MELSIKSFGMAVLMLIVLAGLVPAAYAGEAAEAGEMRLGIHDTLTEIQAVSLNDTFYVPLRRLADELEWKLSGTPEELAVSGARGSLKVIGGSRAVMEDGTELGIQTFKRGGNLMIPLKLAVRLGYSVSYKPDLYLLRITDGTETLDDAAFAAKYKAELAPKPAEPEAVPAASSRPGPKPASGRTVYLTFDDGPSSVTGQLLDILERHGAKATFFMLGPNMEKYPKQVRRMVSLQEGLGLHGISHVKDKFYASPAAALNEMNRDNADLKKTAGVTTSLIRTPYGSKPYFTKDYRDMVLASGYHLWDWNVDSLDWKYKSDSASIYKSVVKQVSALNERGVAPVILMHDQKATLKVLPRILDYLHSKGYRYEIITPALSPVNFWKDTR